MKTEKALSWDDVCLVPQFSTIRSRSEPDTTCKLGDLTLKTPIISANMDTITESRMAITMWKAGGIGALHRFMPIEKQVEEFREVLSQHAYCFVSVGVNDVQRDVRELYAAGARHVVIDIAHGHCIQMKEAIELIRSNFPDVCIMAGNVATGEAVRDLAKWGAKIVKVGVGGGSICKTRVVTGHGVPMFSSVMDCVREADLNNVQIVADGGIRSSGDIVKAIVAGANAVMVGSLLSGTTEAPGEIKTVLKNGEYCRVKTYRGMASSEAQGNRQWGSNGVKVAPEGVSTTVPYKGHVGEIINELTMGLKSGMSYSNSRNLDELYTKAKWREQTHSAYIEGTPHILKGND